MIVDTSALVAIFASEVEAEACRTELDKADRATVSAGSWVELSTVLVRKFGETDPKPLMDALAAAYALTIVPVTVDLAAVAAAGYARFGRGAGHRAKLNFGDCFAYALAKATGEPLLFKGDDFIHTDIMSAHPRG